MPRERCGVRDQSDGEYRKHRSDSTLNADPRLIAAGRYRTIDRANYTKCKFCIIKGRSFDKGNEFGTALTRSTTHRLFPMLYLFGCFIYSTDVFTSQDRCCIINRADAAALAYKVNLI